MGERHGTVCMQSQVLVGDTRWMPSAHYLVDGSMLRFYMRAFYFATCAARRGFKPPHPPLALVVLAKFMRARLPPAARWLTP